MTVKASKSQEIYSYINAPTKICSIDHVKDLIKDKACLTLIEEPFFKSIIKIIDEICEQKVVGDIVMVGVFKGGAALYLWSLFKEKRFQGNLWLFDSFKGFNDSQLTKQKDVDSIKLFGTNKYFESLSSETCVFNLFEKFEVSDKVRIVSGFIENTAKIAPIQSIAFLHIDVDAYDPTLTALDSFYPKINNGGWCVLDDYYVDLFGCRDAVDYYRALHQISNEIVMIGSYPAGWKKQD
jgi:O-methyltransferase